MASRVLTKPPLEVLPCDRDDGVGVGGQQLGNTAVVLQLLVVPLAVLAPAMIEHGRWPASSYKATDRPREHAP